jgi:endonuclease YncB( thermonuclease family)
MLLAVGFDGKPMRSMRAGLILAALLLATSAAAAAERLVGRANVRGGDGDTITVHGVLVRLQGVAAPEIAHPNLGIEEEPGGSEAAAFMRQLVDGKTLVCDLTGERTQGRPVALCYRDGRDVAAEVIAAGLARDCPRFSGGRYASLERPEAKRLPLPGYCDPP